MIKLKDFIAAAKPGWPSNAYVTFKGFESLYVRMTERYLDGARVQTLDIGNIQAVNPGKGAFAKLFEYIRTKHPDLHIYVECIHNKRFSDHLLRLGFKPDPSTTSTCLYWVPFK